MTALENVRDGWNAAARDDAMGNILTTGLSWDSAAFFATGVAEIEQALTRLDDLGLRSGRREAALDFGCGVGRLTVALGEHYAKVWGVDIAAEMIARARPHPHVEYGVCTSRLPFEDDTFDLIYTHLVLQHMPRAISHGYVRDFIRLLHADGLAIFEIPDGPDYQHPESHLSMWATPPEMVEQVVVEAGGIVVDIELMAAPTSAWRPYRYAAKRK